VIACLHLRQTASDSPAGAPRHRVGSYQAPR